ncbi:MAG TPA: hypothetical protein VNO32_04225 [Candidatus Acidoferrum sp.]|nr:hypothetical protein [Candidatus Acidoferrum sp.]
MGPTTRSLLTFPTYEEAGHCAVSYQVDGIPSVVHGMFSNELSSY